MHSIQETDFGDMWEEVITHPVEGRPWPTIDWGRFRGSEFDRNTLRYWAAWLAALAVISTPRGVNGIWSAANLLQRKINASADTGASASKGL